MRVAGIISRNPRESVAFFAASAAVTIIFVNALFMQSGPHPAPIFAHKVMSPAALPPMPQPTRQQLAVPAPLPRPETPVSKIATKPAPEARHKDPIARLLEPSDRVMAAQRVLTGFGYGQIRPTGIVGPETQEAIRKFERSRKMPVTGNLSDQVVQALAEMSGQPIE